MAVVIEWFTKGRIPEPIRYNYVCVCVEYQYECVLVVTIINLALKRQTVLMATLTAVLGARLSFVSQGMCISSSFPW